MKSDDKYIPMELCNHGYIYKLNSRNLTYGAYDSTRKQFIGIRKKFDKKFLFGEYHWDTGPPFGTAKPLEAICYWGSKLAETEANKELFDRLAEIEGTSNV